MADIAIWNKCNNHCIMCTNPFSFQLDESLPYSLQYIKDRWKNVKIDSQEGISLTGGEPTIHPEFFEVISWFRKKYPINQIEIPTNGRMLSYDDFVKKLFRIDNLVLEVALHGYNSATHDSVTRTGGSFIQTVRGIHNVLKYKNNSQELEIRIIITKLNYTYLDKILLFIQHEFNVNQIRDVALIFLEMEGQAKDNFDLVRVTYKEVIKYLIPAVNFAPLFNDFRLYHFPLCILPNDLRHYAWNTLRPEEVIFLPICNKCDLKKNCVGIHRDYYTLIGVEEFKPLRIKH